MDSALSRQTTCRKPPLNTPSVVAEQPKKLPGLALHVHELVRRQLAPPAADRAGVRFAEAATHSEEAAEAMQVRLGNGYASDDFFPSISDLPENLTLEQFRRDYGGVGSQRYRETLREIETRLEACAALALP